METSCEYIEKSRRSYGDDIMEIVTLESLQRDLKQKPTVLNTAPKKRVPTCAFGQMYQWNQAVQNWECQTIPPEQAESLPAGCPTGQVLVRVNQRILCTDYRKISGENADAQAPMQNNPGQATTNIAANNQPQPQAQQALPQAGNQMATQQGSNNNAPTPQAPNNQVNQANQQAYQQAYRLQQNGNQAPAAPQNGVAQYAPPTNTPANQQMNQNQNVTGSSPSDQQPAAPSAFSLARSDSISACWRRSSAAAL
jgi:hypothetical protein